MERRLNSVLVSILSPVVFLYSLGALQPAHGIGDAIAQPYDWTVEVKTEQLERQFEYQGSTIKPVVKAEVKYYEKGEPDNKTDYENLWYHDGKPLGLERKHKYEITEGESVEIRVEHTTGSPTSGEYKAAANAISRILLDSYLHRCPVVIVHIKEGSLGAISSYLQARNWKIQTEEADVAVAAAVNLFLQEGDDGAKQTLYYESI